MKKKNSTHATTPGRRLDIIHAALICFMDKGLSDTSISDICNRSGASIGSIYHHFKSKEQLATAVYLEGIKNYHHGYLNALNSQTNAKEGIRAVIQYHIQWVIDHPEWARYLFKERHASFMGDTEQEFRKLNQAFMQEASQWFRVHINAGKLKKLPPDIFTSILMGPCQEFARQYLFCQTQSDPDKSVTKIALATWEALKQ